MKALSPNPQRGPATPLHASREGLYAVAVSPDGKHLATASKDGITRVFDLATAQLSGGFKAGFQCFSCLCFLLSCSDSIISHVDDAFPVLAGVVQS